MMTVEEVIKQGEQAVKRLLNLIGEDVDREGLQETPNRVTRAWLEWTRGYAEEPANILKTFNDGAENYNSMVVVKDLPFYSQCEHHMIPFFGSATIAYIPDGKVVGLSKLGRVLDAFSRRLQVQERLTQQIAHCLWEALEPKGVGVVVKARHLCMESRGLAKQGHHTITSSLLGEFMDDAKVRAEFLDLAR